MIVNIAIYVPDISPDSNEAVSMTDTIESHLTGKLNSLMGRICTPDSTDIADWWIDVTDGETRYKPENVSEMS